MSIPPSIRPTRSKAWAAPRQQAPPLDFHPEQTSLEFARRIVLLRRSIYSWLVQGVHHGEPFTRLHPDLRQESPEWMVHWVARESDCEGTYILDETPLHGSLSEDLLYERLLHGPAVDPTLPPRSMRTRLSGKVVPVQSQDLSGLDSRDFISVDVFIELFRAAVPGVKIGQFVKGSIQWF